MKVKYSSPVEQSDSSFAMMSSLYRSAAALNSANSPDGKGLRAMVDGQSMSPTLSQGTWIWIKPLDMTQEGKRKTLGFRLGDILVFRMDEHEQLVCHRVIRCNRRWIWQASERYGTFSRVPHSRVLGRAYACEKTEGSIELLNTHDRFTGLLRCYRNLILRHFRHYVRRLIVG